MEYDQDKVDEMVLALLYLTSSSDRYGTRAWKGIDLEVLTRLYQKGYINEAQPRSPTLVMTGEGAKLSKELFFKFFGTQD